MVKLMTYPRFPWVPLGAPSGQSICFLNFIQTRRVILSIKDQQKHTPKDINFCIYKDSQID